MRKQEKLLELRTWRPDHLPGAQAAFLVAKSHVSAGKRSSWTAFS